MSSTKSETWVYEQQVGMVEQRTVDVTGSAGAFAPCVKCPRCGSDYLHTGEPKPYQYGKEAGVRIPFDCEGCGDGLELGVIDYKGNVYIHWLRISERGSE